MIRSNSWLKEDIQKLKELAGAGWSMITLMTELQRTENAIRKQASIHKIVLRQEKEPEPEPISLKTIVLKPPSRTWSQKELDDLEIMLEKETPLYDISVHLERTKSSVKLMSHRLRLCLIG